MGGQNRANFGSGVHHPSPARDTHPHGSLAHTDCASWQFANAEKTRFSITPEAHKQRMELARLKLAEAEEARRFAEARKIRAQIALFEAQVRKANSAAVAPPQRPAYPTYSTYSTKPQQLQFPVYPTQPSYADKMREDRQRREQLESEERRYLYIVGGGVAVVGIIVAAIVYGKQAEKNKRELAELKARSESKGD